MNIQDLIPRILEATREKKIDWKELENEQFFSRVAGAKFIIGHNYDDDSGEGFYRFSVLKGGGDFVYDGQLVDMIVANRFRGPYSDLEELYSEARRNALGLDEIISRIDNELAKLLK